MRVDPAKPYKIIFSLNPDTEIGPVIEPYVVQLNNNNSLSLTYQRLYAHTMKAFMEQLDHAALEIIRITSEYAIDNITRKFCNKDVRPHEFIAKYLTEDLLKDHIRPFVEDRIYKCLSLLHDKMLYLRGKSGNPAHQELEMEEEMVSVRFHFHKEEEGTRYYPTFRCNEEKLTFLNKEVMVVTNKPCILLVENKLYYFEPQLEGKKLTPFFNKWNIFIPKSSEQQYYRRFISQLIEKHHVIARGFDIFTIEAPPKPVLKINNGWNGFPQIHLYFDYQREKILASESKKVVVKMEKNGENFTYYKISRQLDKEAFFASQLLSYGLKAYDTAIFIPEKETDAPTTVEEIVSWLSENRETLLKDGYQILQEGLTSNYYIGKIELDFQVKDHKDWFDVYAKVKFGNFEIPFVSLKKYILNGIKEFQLPDGKIAFLPEEWFVKYKDLLALSSGQEENALQVKKHHFTLLDDIFGSNIVGPAIKKDFFLGYEKLREAQYAVPEHLEEQLRPYQKEGFYWMSLLRDNYFGGCLADDMGLGKTIQTLSLLHVEINRNESIENHSLELSQGQLSLFSEPGNGNGNGKSLKKKHPSLIIMPTSLVHNWQYEIKKWAPQLKVVIYTGLDREEKLKYFRNTDIILTTYGTARNDVDTLRAFEFNYIILDESQIIKNPMAKVSKAVKMLRSRHRLSLTGTPIENSLTDLWSQMSFLNPGLLGSYQYFRDEFAIPIEKKNDEHRKQKLQLLIKPFILRRTKEQVAKDLPELSEKIYFSEMSEDQRQVYEQTRNYYRKQILENMDTWGEKKAQFYILRGLMQLRLIANHPRLFNEQYTGQSGKFEDIGKTLESILEENHRVLVFSQFVRHLDLIARHLQNEKIPYAYLTGQTRDREQAVNEFKQDEANKVFLISLKAGGVGLNLTEADYVFLCDPWWNPAAEQQAISRAHRIGQNKKVIAYKFISTNTVEEKILMLQEKKLQLSSDFIKPGTADFGFDKEDIEMLFS